MKKRAFMEKEQKKSKMFSEIAEAINQIIKKPLTREEVERINSILENKEEKIKDEKKPKVAKPYDSESNM